MHGLADQGFTSVHTTRGQPSLSCLAPTFTKPLRKLLHMLNTQPSTNVTPSRLRHKYQASLCSAFMTLAAYVIVLYKTSFGGAKGEFAGTPTWISILNFFVPPLNKMSKCSPAVYKLEVIPSHNLVTSPCQHVILPNYK